MQLIYGMLKYNNPVIWYNFFRIINIINNNDVSKLGVFKFKNAYRNT